MIDGEKKPLENNQENQKEDYSRYDEEVASKANERAKKEAKARESLIDKFRNSLKTEEAQ